MDNDQEMDNYGPEAQGSNDASAVNNFIMKGSEAGFGEHEKEVMEHVLTLHECINDTETGTEGARIKAQLVQRLALEELRRREANDYDIQLLNKIHEPTGTPTYNVQVRFGNPSTGPHTIIMVHHDTIKQDAKKRALSYSNSQLQGATLQDDTIHLAATIAALRHIKVPDEGAITVVFTDYEENGCRGSGALAPDLASECSHEYPVNLIALESTHGKLAIGHRGKFSAEVVAERAGISPGELFADFFQKLAQFEFDIHTESEPDKSPFGPTSGTSTFGSVDTYGLHAKLDFRTNETYDPDKIIDTFPAHWKSDHFLDITQHLPQIKKLLNDRKITIDKRNGALSFVSDTHVRHPSKFDPFNNELVLPTMYYVVRLLMEAGHGDKITEIRWGLAENPNSVPHTGEIIGNFEDINLQNLIANDQVENNPRSLNGLVSYSLKNVASTATVLTENQALIQDVTHELGSSLSQEVNTDTMRFMTDIGTLFGILKKRNVPVNGFVYGVGDSALLHHHNERISVEDVMQITRAMQTLPNIIHAASLAA